MDSYLTSFQQAFRPELQTALHGLRIPVNSQVLDCPCGNGFYTALLAGTLLAGTLVAADNSNDCLRDARRSVSESSHLTTRFTQCDIYALPFEPDTFDFVWCAQSFITLEEPVRALMELARVTRPGSRVAVLETDEFHHVLLPWPVELELAVFRAVRAECRKRYGSDGKFAQSRRIRSAFMKAGLTPAGRTTIVADRSAPFGPAEREFLTQHFHYLREFVRPELTPRELQQLDQFLNPKSEDGLLHRADVEMTVLATVSHATRE